MPEPFKSRDSGSLKSRAGRSQAGTAEEAPATSGKALSGPGDSDHFSWLGHLRSTYHLVMTNTSPWKITMLLRTVNHVNHLFLWAMASMAM